MNLLSHLLHDSDPVTPVSYRHITPRPLVFHSSSLRKLDGASISISCHCIFLRGRALASLESSFFFSCLSCNTIPFYRPACHVNCILLFRDVILARLDLTDSCLALVTRLRFRSERNRLVKHELHLPFSVQGSLVHRLHQPQLKTMAWTSQCLRWKSKHTSTRINAFRPQLFISKYRDVSHLFKKWLEQRVLPWAWSGICAPLG
ncbi:hypothetical protein V8C42DRAFT_37426 [Trichoderma barbatum]